MKTTLVTIVVAALAGTSSAQAQAPVAQPTVQQQFDAGDAALAAKDWAKAAGIYAALETRLASSKSERNKAIVALRKALSQSYLDRSPESEATIRGALDRLPAADASLANDRWTAALRLGDLAARRHDYSAANRDYRRALENADSPGAKVVSYDGLISSGLFVDRERALADADAMLALLTAQANVNREWLGMAQMLRGRALLNLGRAAEARDVSAIAIEHLGGLNYGKVNLLDTAARSDAAIAAIRAGDAEAARRMLSFAGAAMQSNQGFELPAAVEAPPCGGEGGPLPDDVAVIELAIADDGTVSFSRPVYFSGKPGAAADFAKAVAKWTWSAEELRKISPFFRYQTRVEMRCTNVFGKPSMESLLRPAADAWLASRAEALGAAPSGPTAQLAWLKDELARREAKYGKMSIHLLPVVAGLAGNFSQSRDDMIGHLRRMARLAQANEAPPGALAFFLIASGYALDNDVRVRNLRAALSDPSLQNDITTRNAISLALFDAMPRSERRQEGRDLLSRIANDASLPSADPFRVGALVRLANVEASAGAIDSARTFYQQTGLSGQQCALVDARPRQTGGSISSNDYPMEAMRWGFGGWAMMEFDIAADGRPQQVRPLVAFPPFIFGEPTAKQIRGFKYEQSYRPDGGPGCVGQRQRVTYKTGITQ
jgi:hypothetical protein